MTVKENMKKPSKQKRMCPRLLLLLLLLCLFTYTIHSWVNVGADCTMFPSKSVIVGKTNVHVLQDFSILTAKIIPS